MTVMKNEKGFALVLELVLVAIVVGVVAITGYRYLAHKKQSPLSLEKKAPKEVTTPPSPSPSNNVGTTPTSNSTVPPPATNTPAPTTAPHPAGAMPVPQAAVATVNYHILADGTAQVSPVTTTLNTTGNVELQVNLSCVSSCQFRLASDSYPLANSATYIGSQTLKYTLTQHGTWYFYNAINSGTKYAFGIRF